MDDGATNNIIKSTDEEMIIEGEPLDQDTDTTSSSPRNNSATVTLSLENLIRGHINTIGTLKNEAAEHNDTLNNILLNDATFKEHEEAAKKAIKVKTATKGEIMKRPEVLQVSNKLKAAREEIKEQQATLSDLLTEYQRSTGLDSIELDNGQVKKIRTSATLTS